ncbi:LysR family transcriptional regulator [Sphingomonas sp. Leaf205]|uniref:LysR family transcriptional regulator n=1 Tax=Sphingomonas sp. Leaf205 TaxID=2876551 RepID=UPI001E55964B|nr:LysR family transcriptional regulator [Sphingomonas sp. Leaf205]
MVRSPMEMHQVRYFLAMARLLNFTRAAEESNVSQPSLTRAIQKLEDEFGGELFRRERSHTHLTSLGRQMLPHLTRTFEAAQATMAFAKGIGRAGVVPLALGVDAAIESDTLDRIVEELADCLPGFELSLSSGSPGDLIEAAMNGTLDLVVIELPDDAPDRFDVWPLFDHSYHMVTRAGHPLAGGAMPSLLSVRDESWIDHEGNGCARLKTLAAPHGFVPIVRHSATDMAQVKQLVISGLGSAFIPRPRDDERLCAFTFADVEVRRDVVLGAVAGRKRSIAADAFVRASRARSWAAAAA